MYLSDTLRWTAIRYSSLDIMFHNGNTSKTFNTEIINFPFLKGKLRICKAEVLKKTIFITLVQLSKEKLVKNLGKNLDKLSR